MHGLLQKLLAKRGMKDIKELNANPLPDGSPSEKAIFETWNVILSKEELNIEDIKKFCQAQLEIIESKWQDLNIENSKKTEWIPYHNVYKTLLTAIDSPKVVRESLERQLQELTK